jgi:hypothetical protein
MRRWGESSTAGAAWRRSPEQVRLCRAWIKGRLASGVRERRACGGRTCWPSSEARSKCDDPWPRCAASAASSACSTSSTTLHTPSSQGEGRASPTLGSACSSVCSVFSVLATRVSWRRLPACAFALAVHDCGHNSPGRSHGPARPAVQLLHSCLCALLTGAGCTGWRSRGGRGPQLRARGRRQRGDRGQRLHGCWPQRHGPLLQDRCSHVVRRPPRTATDQGEAGRCCGICPRPVAPAGAPKVQRPTPRLLLDEPATSATACRRQGSPCCAAKTAVVKVPASRCVRLCEALAMRKCTRGATLCGPCGISQSSGPQGSTW